MKIKDIMNQDTFLEWLVSSFSLAAVLSKDEGWTDHKISLLYAEALGIKGGSDHILTDEYLVSVCARVFNICEEIRTQVRIPSDVK